MTPAMGAIYDAITDLMDACLKELRRSNKVLAADCMVADGDRAVMGCVWRPRCYSHVAWQEVSG